MSKLGGNIYIVRRAQLGIKQAAIEDKAEDRDHARAGEHHRGLG